MAAYQKYKSYSIESIASPNQTGLAWSVEITVTWQDGGVEKSKKLGPYEDFHEQALAELRGINSAIVWINAGKPFF